MKAILTYKNSKTIPLHLSIGGSKSESNRLLILQALFPNITIENISPSDDTKVLQQGIHQNNKTVDVHHAGTAMRFLTAYFAAQEGKLVTLTGSERMQQRPISVLVDALRDLGADINYLGNDGFPPIKIKGRKLEGESVTLDASVSSQFISALMLIAPSLENGLKIKLKDQPVSTPYIKMTLGLLEGIGVACDYSDSIIQIQHKSAVNDQTITVESDWSSASYFFSLASISDNLTLGLKNFQLGSLQGDSTLVGIYEKLGVQTSYNEEESEITISKSGERPTSNLKLNLVNTPDIAQTIAVSCLALGVQCELIGLQTLKIKETDRLCALKKELEKLGAKVDITENSLSLYPSEKINRNVTIATYNDHRMAMAFAPLAVKTTIAIANCEVVSKSFPSFWKDLERLGLNIDFQ